MEKPTKGEYQVGISFNPGGDENVADIKRKAADLIDTVDKLRSEDAFGTEEQAAQVARCKALAITAIEDGAMWAVKAATKGA